MMRDHIFGLVAMAAASLACAQPIGAEVYANKCIACHQADGAGAPGLAPPLTANVASHAATAAGRQYLVTVPLTGLAGGIVVEGVRYQGAMPVLPGLSDADIAAVLGYILTDFGHQPDVSWLSADYVATARKAGGTPNDTHKMRGRLTGSER